MTPGTRLQDGSTIFAPATGRGGSAIAVIRLSGPDVWAALTSLIDQRSVRLQPRHAHLVRLSSGGNTLDQALAIWFPGPASFTGEDMAELQVHGGPAVVSAVLQALSEQPGCRMAEAGEFSQRAFLNGKLDLTQAEGVADLVAAETESQRRQALRQTEGALGALYAAWHQRLLRASAHLEAAIDFADEDLPGDLYQQVVEALSGLRADLASHLRDGERGVRLRDGIRLAIIGPPNAGKSSLLNWLSGRDAASVSDVPGTTRDVVEATLDIGGYPVVLADTAGLRETQDSVEAEGVRRAMAQAKDADLRILVLDGGDGRTLDMGSIVQHDILLRNKVDTGHFRRLADGHGLDVSIKTGAGMEAFYTVLLAQLEDLAGVADAAAPTRTRHRHALRGLDRRLSGALEALDGGLGPEVVAEDVRAAQAGLGVITGRVGVEDLLDVIFRDFCIGK